MTRELAISADEERLPGALLTRRPAFLSVVQQQLAVPRRAKGVPHPL